MQSQRTRRIPQSIHSYIQIHSFFQGETFRSCITFFYFPTALKKLQRKELKNLEPKSYDSYKIPLLFQTYIDHIPTLSSFLLEVAYISNHNFHMPIQLKKIVNILHPIWKLIFLFKWDGSKETQSQVRAFFRIF